jgi:HSP20 family molecular chaperone IbpA
MGSRISERVIHPKEFVMMTNGYADLSQVFDQIFDAAQNVGEEIKKGLNEASKNAGEACGARPGPDSRFNGRRPFGPGFSTFGASGMDGEYRDYYPLYNYPPMNVYMNADRSMNFEFALAGFDENDISLSFQGDYMVFSAKLPAPEPKSDTDSSNTEEPRYFKRRLRMHNIEKQKYYCPMDKYAQEKVKAVFKNGVLKVTVPPKEEPDLNDGVKIEIVNE